MTSLTSPHSSEKTEEERQDSFWALATSDFTLLLFATAVIFELTIGVLLYYRLVPGVLRWIGDMFVFMMFGVTLLRMLKLDRIPQVLLLLISITLIGVTVAAWEGQAVAATVWGWWNLFKYPMVALFVYLSSDWPPSLARLYYRFCFFVLGLQIVFQVLQFLSGEPPGDNLTGTFGRQATHPLSTYMFLTLGLALGYWLVYRDWKVLGYVALGTMVVSAFGAIRFFPIGAAIITLFAAVLYLARGRHLDRSFFFMAAAITALLLFPLLYNKIVAGSGPVRTWQETIMDTNKTEDYFNGLVYDADADIYRLGRNYSLRYGWEALQRDTTTLLFGYGIGARSYSSSLGVIGIRNRLSALGVVSGTTAFVMIEELGIVGLSMLALFFIWLSIRLWRCGRNECADEDLRVMAYGLLLFTLLWPVLFWYDRSWDYSVAMLLYWGGIGYAFRICASYRRHENQLLN